MNSIYFKKRRNFDFKPHKYDLGIPFWQKKSHLDMHFLNKVVELDKNKHENLYNYHKDFYLKNVSDAKEKIFINELYEFFKSRLNIEDSKDSQKFGKERKKRHEYRISKYKAFMGLLEDLDEWNIIKPKNETQKIKELKEEIKELKSELKKFTVKNEHKIEINDEDIDVLIDVFHQMQKLAHWKPGKSHELLISHSQNTWAKIISNYFTLRSKHLSFHTIKKKFHLDNIEKFHNKRKYEIKIKDES